MRRKVEILKYNGNSTQSNTVLTKAQTWSQLVNGTITRNTSTSVSNVPIQNANGTIIGNTSVTQIYSVINCPNDAYIPTPSSSCDIPGPLFYLKNEPNVPLYNYIPNTQTLSIINETKLPEINVYTFNVLLSATPFTLPFSTTSVNTNTDIIASISVNSQSYTTYTKTYTISIPIQMYVSGTINTGSNDGTSGNIFIKNYTCSIYYNNSVVFSRSTDISRVNVSFTTTTNGNGSKKFNGVVYLGNITISNIPLIADVGFLYDIKMQFKLCVPSPSFSFVDYTVGVKTNMLDPNPIWKNCIMTTNPAISTNTFQPFSFG
jgi:hypothetical protein